MYSRQVSLVCSGRSQSVQTWNVQTAQEKMRPSVEDALVELRQGLGQGGTLAFAPRKRRHGADRERVDPGGGHGRRDGVAVVAGEG